MFHLVWTPKYRKRLLKDAIKERLIELFQECADMNGWKIHELN
jgi:putative transposase